MRYISCYISILSILALLTLLPACEDPVPPGKIMVLNDSQDSEYNVIEVSGGGSYYTLSPGEHALLPRGTRSITMSRQYKDYTREYQVECPDLGEKGIRIKMIDVHVNRIAGGCKTVSGLKR